MPMFFTVTKAFVTSPMPCVISRLVLQPNMSKAMDCTGTAVKVSVGMARVLVGVGDDVIVFSGVTGDITVTFDAGVFVLTKMGGGIIKGVGVKMPGVWVGTGVQTGNG